jgi:hypothetical protein
MCSELLSDLIDVTLQNYFRAVDQRDRVTQFFNRFHVVCRKDNGGAGIAQPNHFPFHDICIHRIEAAERFIEYQ